MVHSAKKKWNSAQFLGLGKPRSLGKMRSFPIALSSGKDLTPQGLGCRQEL